MADHRFSRGPGPSEFEGKKGPNGRQLCFQCGTEISGRARRYCSNECGRARLALWPSEQRDQVLKRDRGICAECGLDCLKLAKDVRARNGSAIALASKLGIPYTRRVSFWDMDHVVPVVEGGGSCGLENLRTLCIPCHRRVTTELAKRRAEQRKQQKAANA